MAQQGETGSEAVGDGEVVEKGGVRFEVEEGGDEESLKGTIR